MIDDEDIKEYNIWARKQQDIRKIIRNVRMHVNSGLSDLDSEGVLTTSNEHDSIKEIVGDCWENQTRGYGLNTKQIDILRKELQKEYKIRL